MGDKHPLLIALRKACGWEDGTVWQVCGEIERLRKENEQLREQLENAKNWDRHADL